MSSSPIEPEIEVEIEVEIENNTKLSPLLQSLSLTESTALLHTLLTQSPPGQLPRLASLLKTIYPAAVTEIEAAERELALKNGFLVRGEYLVLAGNVREGGKLINNEGEEMSILKEESKEGELEVLKEDEELKEGELKEKEELKEEELKGDEESHESIESNPNDLVESNPNNKKCKTTTNEALLKAIADYMTEFYGPNGHFAFIPTNVNDEFHLHLLARKVADSNFWGVNWHSQWHVKGDEIVSGQAALAVHYWEDGNVQLHAHKACTGIAFSSPAQLVKAIRNLEDALQVSLNDSYQQLAESSFKRLRRQLPVTRQKMDWTKFATYKLKSELEQK